MRTCLRIPRLYHPRNGYEKWAVIACDRFAPDRAYWERVAKEIGDAPSVLSCISPDAFLGDEDEARLKSVHEGMYEHLESGALERLYPGMIYVVRETTRGERRGLVAMLDLEEYSPECEKGASIRASTQTLPSLVEARRNVRQESVMEFPHAILLYRDKKDKLLRELDKEELELLYDVELPGGGGNIKGYFLYQDLARNVIRELHGYADPCFIVAEGNHSLAASKQHWEDIKKTISETETRNHPARFFLAEFVNVMSESVVFEPVHRVVSEIETEAFCDYFARNVKCKREGNLLYPVLTGSESYNKVDQVIQEYRRINFGKVNYCAGRPVSLAKEDSVVIALPAVDKNEVVDAVKHGRLYPPKCFRLGAEQDARYCFEGREISYD